MKRPFNIFPSIGYRNSQFQIVSSVDNLSIDIYEQDKVIKSIETNSKYPTLLTNINSTGNLTAKCIFNNEIFQQEIEIKEAYRLGTSEFKKAFVFDDTDFSFFLMKDRLLLYDEKKKILLTENHYSPTEIHKINETNFLFVTRVGSSDSGIVNLGIYNTETFSLVGELLNDYREIKILSESNKAWLYNIKSKTIHCYELAQKNNSYFIELKIFTEFIDFFLDDTSLYIYVNCNEVVKISSLNNLHKSLEINKLGNNAIDKKGNVFRIEGSQLTCVKIFANYSETVKTEFEVNLQNEVFIHVGQSFQTKDELIDLNIIADEIKNEIVPSIPEDKTNHYYTLTDQQRRIESYITHIIYPTNGGVFISETKKKRIFKGVSLKKNITNWIATPSIYETFESSLSFLSSDKTEVLIDKIPCQRISGQYHNSMLYICSQNKKILFSGNNKFIVDDECAIYFFTTNEIAYCLIKSKDMYSLYRSTNLGVPILDQIKILNFGLIEKHQVIWYQGKEKYLLNTCYLNAFDLKSCSIIPIDEKKVQHSLFKDAIDFKFFDNYALSSNQIVFNPKNFEIRDAFVGNIESFSKHLNKIVSFRTNTIYLSVFNSQIGKYELSQVSIDDKKYKESYLSPNGQFLVLQDESNKYAFYDLEKNETINFISGTFLAFRNDGSLIIEQNGSKAIKILDPITFQDITPPNYHHYRFMSPDGKLFAQVSSKVRYFNKLNGKELKIEEVLKFRQDYDELSYYLIEEEEEEEEEEEKEQAKIKVAKNRLEIFNSNKAQFQTFGIEDFNKITSNSLVKIEKYTEIGICQTNIVKDIILPDDTQFYNYSSFSYDNKYLGMVYRLGTGGGIHFIKLNFDENKSSLEIVDTYLSRYPRYASWVCGFSKTGFFATYDSTPDTYIINVAENLFENKTTEIELKQNIYKTKTNVYHSYNKWNEIIGKNFLCFSPTGNFLALSEQGYEPLTQGGYGHQESNVVHIAKTITGQIMDSFTGHGDKIKDNKTKKVTFVAFSEDERRIMTLSSDGVVIIRDIIIKAE